jgi:uncharacterized FlaG/YvyC family protein
LEVPQNMKEPEEHHQMLILHKLSYLLKMTSDEILNFVAQITKKNRTLETSLSFSLHKKLNYSYYICNQSARSSI